MNYNVDNAKKRNSLPSKQDSAKFTGGPILLHYNAA